MRLRRLRLPVAAVEVGLGPGALVEVAETAAEQVEQLQALVAQALEGELAHLVDNRLELVAEQEELVGFVDLDPWPFRLVI